MRQARTPIPIAQRHRQFYRCHTLAGWSSGGCATKNSAVSKLKSWLKCRMTLGASDPREAALAASKVRVGRSGLYHLRWANLLRREERQSIRVVQQHGGPVGENLDQLPCTSWCSNPTAEEVIQPGRRVAESPFGVQTSWRPWVLSLSEKVYDLFPMSAKLAQ
jgi:hypothetical protein